MIEIKELFVKVNVNQDQEKKDSGKSISEKQKLLKEEIISECLEQLAELLKNKKER